MGVAAMRQIGNPILASIGRDHECVFCVLLRAGEPGERLILVEITWHIVRGTGAIGQPADLAHFAAFEFSSRWNAREALVAGYWPRSLLLSGILVVR